MNNNEFLKSETLRNWLALALTITSLAIGLSTSTIYFVSTTRADLAAIKQQQQFNEKRLDRIEDKLDNIRRRQDK